MKDKFKKTLKKHGIDNTAAYKAFRETYARFVSLVKFNKAMQGVMQRECTLCGFHGYFKWFGMPPRFDARCPSCGSLERHRLFAILDKKLNITQRNSQDILHFAPEPVIQQYLRERSKTYISADLYAQNVDTKQDIEALTLEDQRFDLIFCSHVFEHVDDKKAMSELYRVLRSNGVLVAMVPIVEAWDTTYENTTIIQASDREMHFGQHDHVRYYGRDFAKRLNSFGFQVEAHTATPQETVSYGLVRGERVFICRKDKSLSAS